MRKERYEVDFFTMFKLPQPTCGMICKIISDRGIRKVESDNIYSYFFKDESELYHNKSSKLEPGIYHIMDICKLQEEMQWCHYLFIIDQDGSVYPVAEYLKQPDTRWVKKALPVVKDYFRGKNIDPIEITDLRPKKRKSSWKIS